MLIDLLVSILSGGLTTRDIGKSNEEYGLSQLFIAFDLEQLSNSENTARAIQDVTESLLETTAIEAGGQVFYPGQQTWLRREENLKRGIPVDRHNWEKITALGRE